MRVSQHAMISTIHFEGVCRSLLYYADTTGTERTARERYRFWELDGLYYKPQGSIIAKKGAQSLQSCAYLCAASVWKECKSFRYNEARNTCFLYWFTFMNINETLVDSYMWFNIETVS